MIGFFFLDTLPQPEALIANTKDVIGIAIEHKDIKAFFFMIHYIKKASRIHEKLFIY
jgi:hypothetical protein